MIRRLVLAVATIGAFAAAPSAALAVTQQFGVWTVHMTVVHYNYKSKDFKTPNHISLSRPGVTIDADRASGNFGTRVATLVGHVTMDEMGPKGPARMTADTVRIQGGGAFYVATGDVHYVQAATSAAADRGTLDQTTHEMTLDGHVVIVNAGRVLHAEHATYNTLTGKGRALRGTFRTGASG